MLGLLNATLILQSMIHLSLLLHHLFVPLTPSPALHYKVPEHAEPQCAQQHADLDIGAQEAAVGEGSDEAQRFPQAVVGEGRLFSGDEHAAVKG